MTAAAGGGSGNIQRETKKLYLMRRMWRSLSFVLADGCNGLNIVPNIYKQNKLLWPDGPCRCGEPGRMQTQDLIQAQVALIVSSAG